MLCNEEALQALSSIDISCEELIELVDFLFETEEIEVNGGEEIVEQERVLTFDEFIEVALEMRGSAHARLVHISDLRKFAHDRFTNLEMILAGEQQTKPTWGGVRAHKTVQRASSAPCAPGSPQAQRKEDGIPRARSASPVRRRKQRTEKVVEALCDNNPETDSLELTLLKVLHDQKERHALASRKDLRDLEIRMDRLEGYLSVILEQQKIIFERIPPPPDGGFVELPAEKPREPQQQVSNGCTMWMGPGCANMHFGSSQTTVASQRDPPIDQRFSVERAT